MKNKKIVLGIVILVITIGIMGIWVKKNFHKGGWLLKKVEKTLDLNENQSQFLKTTGHDFVKLLKESHSNRVQLLKKLTLELDKEQLEEEALEKLIKEFQSVHANKKDFILDKMVVFHKMLNPEQRGKLVKKLKRLTKKYEKKFSEK